MATGAPAMTKPYVIERRIVCTLCSGAKHTFPHTPDGLTLFAIHLDIIHRVTMSQAERNGVTNA